MFCGDVQYKTLIPIIGSYEYKNTVVRHHTREMDAELLMPVTSLSQAIYYNNSNVDDYHTNKLKSRYY